MPPSLMPTKVFQYAKFNLTALCDLATRLRGQRCECDPSQTPLSGSLNWVITVRFEDEVEWILRCPRNYGAISSYGTTCHLLASEAATLKYLNANSAIPVPEVFAYSPSRDNEIGVPYILMSKARGFPLSHKWHSMTHKDKSKVLHQLGMITWQLSRLPFGQIGSLFENESGLQVQTCLGRGMVIYGRDSLEDIDRGPFLTSDAYFKAMVSVFSDHAQCLNLEHHCFFAPIPLQREYNEWSQYQAACDRWNDFAALGDRIDCAPNRMDYVIAGDLLWEMIAELLKNAPAICGSSTQQAEKFYLRHPDLSVNNIFIDDQYHITCLMDWGFCSTGPLPVLLTAPGLPQARDKLEESLVSAFEEGFRSSAFDALQGGEEYHSLCEALQYSRPIWYLSRLLDFDSIEDFNVFRELWRSIHPNHKDISTEFWKRQAAPYYRQLYKEMKEEEPSAERISRHERECFPRESELRLSIARKLSLVSDWRSRYEEPSSDHIRRNADVFVADKRLWQWIGACLVDLIPNDGYSGR